VSLSRGVNPANRRLPIQSAKLPLSFPKTLEQNPSYLNYRSEGGRVLYGEDVYVGYRYYEKVKAKPLFPFGHGLSYTAFRLSDLVIEKRSSPTHNIKEETLEVSVGVENVGTRSGAETALVYVSPPPTTKIRRPLRELKGFKKVKLGPGEKQRITVSIPTSVATSYWDEGRSAWLSEAGEYKLAVVGTGEDNSVSGAFTVDISRWWTGLPTPVTEDVSAELVDGTGPHH